MKTRLVPLLLAFALAWPQSARSFCGFYVASGDAKLYNKASQVVLARDGDRTTLTMASDYQGEPTKFAIVVPVPVVLRKDQVHIGDAAVVEHLDAFSAPRLVEYFDPDPCGAKYQLMDMVMSKTMVMPAVPASRGGRSSGVTIEARYTVGEYDILILSAKQSSGLARWLGDHGYRVPPAATRVLDTYLKQGMKFFVAKVNLSEQQRLGFTKLRPIQMTFTSPRFMLPIRLGLVNADGPQELFVYAITRGGRVECVNYRTVRLPTDSEIPEYVQADFRHFYRDLFTHQVERQDEGVVFTEYAWNMRWCDPCAAQPLSNDELRGLGAVWVDETGTAADVFMTRLHVRYDREHFPEDLVFQITGDTQNFQGRYVIRHEWKGQGDCDAVRSYRESLTERHRRQAETLVELTGWAPDDVRGRMGAAISPGAAPGTTAAAATPSLAAATRRSRPWWERLWSR